MQEGLEQGKTKKKTDAHFKQWLYVARRCECSTISVQVICLNPVDTTPVSSMWICQMPSLASASCAVRGVCDKLQCCAYVCVHYVCVCVCVCVCVHASK